MIRKVARASLYFLFFLLALAFCTITKVDRQPYKETDFYATMDARLDSLKHAYRSYYSMDTLKIGWSKVSITPESAVPLAGYGARKPKTMDGIHDSSFVRTLYFQLGDKKVALISADILVIHPELRLAIAKNLPATWDINEIYFTATHTHSGIGGWAPGIVGKLFSGSFNPEIIDFLQERFIQSVISAEKRKSNGVLGYSEASVDDLVYNRLVKGKGEIDPWMKVLKLANNEGLGLHATYSAHATCFGRHFHKLSGDYPSRFNRLVEQDTNFRFSSFSAGAVASMGPKGDNMAQEEKTIHISSGLKEQADFLQLIGIPLQPINTLNAFQVKLALRKPYFKISNNLALRPYLFDWVFGDYEYYISVLTMGDLVFLGFPCDFSGELALDLYDQARENDQHLTVTSFNGGYIGYIIKDDWYDLTKYEARTMSWYGPDAGTYLSEVASRIIEIVNDHQ